MDCVIVNLEFWFDRIPNRSYGLVRSGMNTSYRYLKYQRNHWDLLITSISLCRTPLRDCFKLFSLLPRSISPSFDLSRHIGIVSSLSMVNEGPISYSARFSFHRWLPMEKLRTVSHNCRIDLLAIMQRRTLISLDLHSINTFSESRLSMSSLKWSSQTKLTSWWSLELLSIE